MSTLLTPGELHFNPLSSDRPSEWALPSELLELLDNNGEAYFSPEGRAALNRIALGEWFLIRTREMDDVLVNKRCRQCGQRHDYITVACVPAPFNGLRQLHVMLRSQTPVDAAFRPFSWRDIEVISAVNAKQLNGRIRDRGGNPPIGQNPPKREELDAVAIRHRILRNAANARRAAVRAGQW